MMFFMLFIFGVAVINILIWYVKPNLLKCYYLHLVIGNNIAIFLIVLYFSDLRTVLILVPIIAFNVFATIKNTKTCSSCNSFVKKGWSDKSFKCSKCGTIT